ncbi:MAG: hypothetical protein KKH57_00845 [Candidatus Omnitrophica bacterium]|nr:hypothetical protein [Candidatus Omnitrophota bacterium]
MRIKIIVPPYVNQPLFLRMMPRSMTFFPPYGASCLASTLRNNGYSVSVEDVSLLARNLKMPPIFLDNKRELKSIVEYLRFDSPDKKIDRFANELFKYISQDGSEVIGFSIFSRLELVCALLLAKKIKENTQAKIVLGGALMTEYAALKSLQKMESILNNFKFVDFVIFGDGCVPFLALLENIKGLRPIETVPNLAYRDKANIAIREKTFYSIQDMPAPDFDGLDLDKYKAVQYEQIKNKKIEAFSKFFQLPYQLSRGCPQGCSFCDCYLTDPQIVFKDPPKVINELWHLKERYRARNFYFC